MPDVAGCGPGAAYVVNGRWVQEGGACLLPGEPHKDTPHLHHRLLPHRKGPVTQRRDVHTWSQKGALAFAEKDVGSKVCPLSSLGLRGPAVFIAGSCPVFLVLLGGRGLDGQPGGAAL